MSTLRVLDERSGHGSGQRSGDRSGDQAGESLRTLIGGLLVNAARADIALSRVRLAALDLTAAEVRSGAWCRVLLGALDASALLDAADHAAGVRPGLRHLAEWLASDRLEVRSAGIGAWTPDFSVYEDRAGASTSLVGAHYFGSPQLTVGPSVTVVTTDRSAARMLRDRFDELWRRAHDVAPAILDVVQRSQDVGAHGGHEPFRP